MLLLVVLSFLMAGQYGNFSAVIPILGAMAIGAQRLLPLLQIIYGAVVDIRRGQRSLESVLELLQMPLPNELSHSEKLPFFRNIEIRNLSFSYKRESRLVLNKVNLIIDKGSRVGIIGPTGGGKTTFMDVLMGLLPTPPDGGVFIDGVKLEIGNVASWRNLIAHVPQDIFLSDCSIAENIALGVDMDSIDLERVSWASEMACLGGVVADLPEGLWTEVGEKGLRLSGGQRQRIAIARALYKGGEIFIFDEATSALDSETESMVIENIEKLCEKPTIIFVAHRISTLKECQKIYRVSESKLTEISKESLGF
jgi:ATP-binding cassette, subfamily B, bacterial PglK